MPKVKDNNLEEVNKISALDTSHKNKLKLANKFWYVQIFFLSLGLSIMFALISEFMLMYSSLALSIFLLLFLILVSVIFDIIGVAVTACSVKPLLELKNKGVKGADCALKLVKNADKVSCICTDVIGDICSILCGAGGVAISVIILTEFESINNDAFVSILISSTIASLIVLGKATGKSYAVNYSTNVMLKVGRFLNLFTKRK